MTYVSEIMKICEEIAPLYMQAEWDNSGLLVGSPDMPADTVLLTLDITPSAVREAHKKGASLIISHHPVIFHPLAALEKDSAAYLLAKYDIAALCLHTNLDRADEGVNYALAKALGLRDITLYPDDFLAVGHLDSAVSADALASHIKVRLRAPSVRFTPADNIRRIAVSSGGGGEGVELCGSYHFDAFVTGELKHHQYLFANENGIAAFDAGHFSTEDVVIRPLCDMLQKRLPDTDFLISEQSVCPYDAI